MADLFLKNARENGHLLRHDLQLLRYYFREVLSMGRIELDASEIGTEGPSSGAITVARSRGSAQLSHASRT
jgi:hypothetical protein